MTDEISPDVGQRVTPDGQITYEFVGHILAQGLDLPTGTQQIPQSEDSRVTWRSRSDNDIGAVLYAFENQPPFEPRQRFLELLAVGDAGETVGILAQIISVAGPLCLVIADTESRLLIDHQGRSAFAGLPTPQHSVLITGAVNNGSPIIQGTGGWASEKLDVGDYLITFNTPFQTGWVVPVLTPMQTGVIASLDVVDETVLRMFLTDFDTGDPVDGAVAFHVLGN